MTTRHLALRALTAALGLSLAPAVALADDDRPKETRDQNFNIDVEKSEATQGLRERAKLKKKNKKQEKARPEITADKFIRIQGKVQHIRDEQIRNFRMLIQDTDDDDPEKPDLLFRLAELWAQKQRYWRFRAMEMYPAIDKAKGGQKRKLKGKQKRYFKESKEALIESIKVYAQIAQTPEFRDYSRMDEALFFYAYTLQSAKKIKLSRKVYKQLIQQYPKSKYVPHAYLSFADYFFEEENLARAEQFYDKVMEFPKSSVYEYAMYKKGWVYLNLDRSQDALETFFKVARITRGDDTKKTLNKAAKKDFVRAYAEVGRAKMAYKAFRRVDKGYAFTMLQLLGDLYVDQGQANKAIYTFRQLMRLEPRHKKVCEWQYNVVRAILSDGTQTQKTNEVERLVKLYKKYEGKNILKDQYEPECRENARATTSELAKIWHNEAIKTLNTDTLAVVENLYKLYLRAFRDAKDWGEMQYYYAELLWSRADNEKNERKQTKLWEDAAVAFTEVVKSGKVKDKLIKESAYAAVLGWKNALAVDPRPEDVPTPEEDPGRYKKIPEPKPIDDRQKKMLEAFDIYIDYVKDPSDDELADMKFYKARIFWRFDHLKKADKLFINILENHPDHEVALYSARLLLDSLNRLHQYDAMNEWVDKLIARDKWLSDKPELRAQLEGLKTQALRKQAEQLEEGGDHVACGEKYRAIYNRDPKAEGVEEVLYNAGVCYEKGKSIGLAIAMFEQLSNRFPDANLTQKAILRLGNNYGAIAYYRKAAERYEAYAQKFGGEEDAPEALNNAVFYRRGVGDDQKAIEDTKYFVKQYRRKRKQEAADAMFGIAGIYEKNNQTDKLVSHLEEYLGKWRRRGGVDRALIAHAKIGQVLWKKSCPVEGDMGACIRVRRERSLAHGQRGRRGSGQPKQCGPESKIEVKVIERDQRLARKAQGHFRKALRLWDGGKLVDRIDAKDEGEKNRRRAKAAYWFAAARFYRVEDDYERYLDVKFPQGLDFSARNKRKKKRSTKRFNAWFGKKEKMSGQVAKKYEEVRSFRQAPAWAIAAAARMGQIAQNFSDALYTAQIPRDVRTGKYAGEKVMAYCDTLTSKAAPLEDYSVKAFGFCLERSTQLNWFNRWSKLCERELGQIRPQDFPTASELHAPPDEVAAITDVQGPILELK